MNCCVCSTEVGKGGDHAPPPIKNNNSFLLLSHKMDLTIPQWSMLKIWQPNNWLQLLFLKQLLLNFASFTDVFFSCWNNLKQNWACSTVIPKTVKEANNATIVTRSKCRSLWSCEIHLIHFFTLSWTNMQWSPFLPTSDQVMLQQLSLWKTFSTDKKIKKQMLYWSAKQWRVDVQKSLEKVEISVTALYSQLQELGAAFVFTCAQSLQFQFFLPHSCTYEKGEPKQTAKKKKNLFKWIPFRIFWRGWKYPFIAWQGWVYPLVSWKMGSPDFTDVGDLRTTLTSIYDLVPKGAQMGGPMFDCQ